MRTARQILEGANTIAVVGLSRHRHKPAHWVPAQVQRQGWRIIPVNPHADEILGEHSYARLADLPERPDLVDVFRPAGDAAEVVRQAIAVGAPAVWLQVGIVSAEARRLATEAGIDYVEDDCIAIERTLGYLVHRISSSSDHNS